MKVYLLQYNNYYNRIVRREVDTYKEVPAPTEDNPNNIETVLDKTALDHYLDYTIFDAIDGVNFIFNDYVNTEYVINYPNDQEINMDTLIPDYLLVVEDDDTINSRWFVIDFVKMSYNQFKLQLRRDVVVDNYNAVIESDMFIEKATPIAPSDSAIFNNEDMTFNQIKDSEWSLTDETQCPWIVGYVPRDAFKTYEDENGEPVVTNHITAQSYGLPNVSNVPLYESISDDPLYKYSFDKGTSFKFIDQERYYFYQKSIRFFWASVWLSGHVQSYTDATALVYPGVTAYEDHNKSYTYGKYLNFDNISSYDNEKEAVRETAKDWIYSLDPSWCLNEMNNGNWGVAGADICSYNLYSGLQEQSLIKVGTATNYTVYRRTIISTANHINLNPNGTAVQVQDTSALGIALKGGTAGSSLNSTREYAGNADVRAYYSAIVGYIKYDILTSEDEVTLSENRYNLTDQPYDMFCIPYSDSLKVSYKNSDNSQVTFTTKKNSGMAIATAIAKELGSGNIYDIQLLPFCPVREQLIKSTTSETGFKYGEISVFSAPSTAYNLITDTSSGNASSILIWATTSNFNIPKIPLNIIPSEDVVERKVETLCDMYRLCSPNYSGLFEFNVSKNDGINYFEVNCSYKPYSPYIHLNPNFNNLYGNDFNDQRGLVCGGDFSLPQVTSQWADYQLANKNYQQIFDREVQNMEVNNAVQREREKWGVASGVVGATVQGATAGAMAGGGWGALIGGAVSGGASLAGGLRDLELNEKLRNEALDYKKDMFGYQLGNIQAIPQGLSKVSAYTINNKVFPFLEKYTCTNIEKNALRNKLKYNGFTIMRIDKLNNFVIGNQNYCKGKLIRLEGSNNDFHIINALADELNKGVFI